MHEGDVFVPTSLEQLPGVEHVQALVVMDSAVAQPPEPQAKSDRDERRERRDIPVACRQRGQLVAVDLPVTHIAA